MTGSYRVAQSLLDAETVRVQRASHVPVTSEVRIEAIRDRIIARVQKMGESDLRRLWEFINPPLAQQA